MNRPTPAQLGLLHAQLARRTWYLARLLKRLEARGCFNTPLYEKAVRAHDAMHALSVATHYESCAGGVGRQGEHGA